MNASLGSWSPFGTSSTIQWQRSGDGSSWSNIPGATSVSYSTQGGDLGAWLRVTVTEANGFGSASATSAPVGPLVSGPPVNAVRPVISGAPQSGSVLAVSPGTWKPTASSYAYAWQYSADGQTGWVSIPAARSASFAVDSTYAGTYLRVRVMATNGAGTTTATSSVVGPVTVAVPVNTVRPTIAGVARVGLRLTASRGSVVDVRSPGVCVAVLGQRSYGMGHDPGRSRRELHDRLGVPGNLPPSAGHDGYRQRVQRIRWTGSEGNAASCWPRSRVGPHRVVHGDGRDVGSDDRRPPPSRPGIASGCARTAVARGSPSPSG